MLREQMNAVDTLGRAKICDKVPLASRVFNLPGLLPLSWSLGM